MTRLKKTGKLFLQKTMLCYNDPVAFYENLNTISEKEFNAAKSTPFKKENIENIKIIIHELQ